MGIWETANLWYFDFVFWGFGKLQVFGILTLYFGDLRLSIREGALVFWGFVVFWGFGKLQIFGILTLYFGDLGNCKSLVF